jgi:hypothetical protein
MTTGERLDLTLPNPFTQDRAREFARGRISAPPAQHFSLQSSEWPSAIRRRQNQD